ncbi:MAG: SufD family Fe-S cluster assembly protein [Wenzhouxiangella sp.]|nr:SufD family Fe-S cluster assembly protein [Wenzhouxiangella sp.]MDR9452623.1 SufD family Fe-S cluster assembly protein [Wenzhouxiangella sp.]
MSALAQTLLPNADIQSDDYQATRKLGLQRLMQHGFPDQKTEQWKYTPLRVLEQRDAQHDMGAPVALPSWPVDATVLHFDGGVLQSSPADLAEGLTLLPEDPKGLEGRDFDALYGGREGAFSWLNLARFDHAWRLEVSGEQTVIMATTTSEGFNASVHPRIRIEVLPGARLTLLQDQQDAGEGLVNINCEIDVAEGARVEHVLCCHTHESVWVQRTDVDIHKDADYRVVAFDRGGRLTRHDLTMSLRDASAHGEIDGLVVMDGRQHVDWHTEIVHCTGHTNSRESFRMLAGGSSVGVFNGRIHIYPDADDSHSDLNTANLLLSDQARVNIKPELEIYSEEVTASHGATIGQLDDRSLFYMRSRGLSEAQSLALLKYGFAAEPLMQIQTPALRDWALERLKEVL